MNFVLSHGESQCLTRAVSVIIWGTVIVAI
jgi:hypothetical protein